MPDQHLRWLLIFALTAFALTFQESQSTNSQSSKPTKAAATSDSSNISKPKVTMPSCSHQPDPPYTKEARNADFQGVVVVEAVIELDGRLSNLKIIKSPGLGLDQKVLETLARWKCKPATRDGKPVRTSVPIEIGFRSR